MISLLKKKLKINNIFSVLINWLSDKLTKNNILLLLLILIAFVTPFIVRLHLLDRPENTLQFLALPFSPIGDYDIFHYYKAIFFIIIVLLCVVLTFTSEKIQKSFYNISLFGFGITILISSLFSKYSSYTFFGGAQSFQGLFVWLSYCILPLIVYNLSKKVNLYSIIYALLICSFIVNIYGLLQILGISESLADFSFLISHSGHILKETLHDGIIRIPRSFFYSSTYYGMFLCMVFFINIGFLFTVKNIGKKIFLSLNLIQVFINFISTDTRISFAFFLICLIILCYFLRKKIIKNKYFKISVSSILIICITFSFIKISYLKEKLNNLIESNFTTYDSDLKEIKVINKGVLIIERFEGTPLYIKIHNEKSVLFSTDSNLKNFLKINQNGNEITFKEQHLKDYKFILEGKTLNFIFNHNFKKHNVIVKYPIVINEGEFKTINRGKIEPIVTPDKWNFFNKHNSFGGRRGFYWALGTPILKKTLFLGYGADTFPLVFPNNDYFSKMKTFRTPPLFFILPHSMYLHIGIEAGVVGLLFFLSSMFYYMFDSFKIYNKVNYKSIPEAYIGLGCLIAVFATLGAGLFNSISLSIGPTFFLIFGIGIALNSKIKKAN